MRKKFIVGCLTLAALTALALPVTASAVNEPDLTESKGGPLLAVGSKVLGTGVGELKLTDKSGKALVNCTINTLTGTLDENKASSFKVTIKNMTSGGTGGVRQGEPECTGTFGNVTFTWGVEGGLPWCLLSNSGMLINDEFWLRGGTCGEKERSIKVTLDSTTIGECEYTRPAAFGGEFQTEAAGDAIFTIGGEKDEEEKVGGGFFCPAAVEMDLSFTLEKDSGPGEPVDPLFIS
jgi:hypothetical protein